MSNSFVQVPTDGAGKKLDTELVITDVGGTPTEVHRERDQIAGTGPTEILDIRGTDPAEDDMGAVVRLAPPVGAVFNYLSGLVSEGGSLTLGSILIPANKTAKLLQATVSCSVACKFQLQKRDGATVSDFVVLFVSGLAGRPMESYKPSDKAIIQLPWVDGDENWQVVVTNLDHHEATAYVTLEWDEV